MRIYKNFEQVNINDYSRIVAGAFFQLQKNCLTRIKEILNSSEKEKMLFVDVEPGGSDADLRLILSQNERMKLLEQVGVDNYIFLSNNRFFEVLKTAGQYHVKVNLVCGLTEAGVNPKPGKEFLCALNINNRSFNWHKQLGFLYPVTGEVVYGNKIGRTLGYPTANVRPDDSEKIIPPMGVYAGWVRCRNTWFKSMINIGIRPTLDLENVTIEAHLFDFSANIYGEEISIHFQSRIRDEMRFSSLEVLKDQLKTDQKVALQLLSNHSLFLQSDNFIIL